MKYGKKFGFNVRHSLYASLIFMLALVLLSGILFWNIQSIVENSCWNTLEENTTLIREEIEYNVQSDVQTLKLMAELLAHCDTLEQMQTHLTAQTLTLSDEYILLLPDNTLVTWDCVAADGTVSFEKEAALGVHISERLTDAESGRMFLRNFVPVESEGRIIGMLYGIIYLDTLPERWNFKEYGGKGSVYVLERKTGDLLLDTWHKSLGNIEELRGREPKKGYSFDDMQKNQSAGGSGRCVFVSKTIGEYLYYYYEPLKINDWSVALSVQESVAFRDAILVRRALIGFAVLEGAALVLYLVWILFYVKRENAENLARMEKEKKAAEHDALTGVMNRRAFDNMLTCLKGKNESLAFMLIDVDKFKQINDRYGHAEGDAVLKYVAELLMKNFRANDSVFRIGGDEFCVVMTGFDVRTKDTVKEKMQKINEQLSADTNPIPPVSLSIGVTFSDKGFYEDMYKEADEALYHVKENGRGNCEFYNKPKTERMTETLQS